MKNSAVKWLWKVTGKYKIGILLLTVVQILHGVSGVIFALFMRNAIDSAVGGDSSDFLKYAIFLAALTVVQICLRAAGRFLEESCRSSVENVLKSRLFGCLLKKDYASVAAVHSGEWLNRLTSDTAVTANGAVEIIPNVSGMAAKLTGALAMLIILEPKFAVLITVGGAAVLLLSYAFRKVLKRLHRAMQESDGVLRVFMQERLSSMTMIRSFAAEKITAESADDKMSDHRRARMRKNHFSNFCNVGFAVAIQGLYLLGFVYGGHGILIGTLSYGTLTAMLQLISQIQAPFANISGYLPKFYAMTASAERLMEAECFADDFTGAIDGEDKVKSFYENEFSGIVFENVSFSYSDNVPVADGISFGISKGDRAAFTGQSGCGKSTIFKLMMCLYKPSDGSILLKRSDGGVQALTAEKRRLFAYVPQGNQLMNGSIREIVTFASEKKVIDKEVSRALEIACADEFVSDLDMVLGERGAGLSEGQLQRIAIARAVYSDCPILLLDEATSALDEQTERRLLNNLEKMTDKTVLIVTHRPEVLEICSKVLKCDEGRITEVTN